MILKEILFMFDSIIDFIEAQEQNQIHVEDCKQPIMNSDGNSFSVTYSYCSSNGNSGLESTKSYNLFEFLDFVYCTNENSDD